MANEDALRKLVREVVRQALSESQSPAAYRAPWTGVEYESHPSRQPFNIQEATVALGDLIEFAQAQACSIETNKPCDHCGACKTLGF
jgi:hypothetical protein